MKELGDLVIRPSGIAVGTLGRTKQFAKNSLLLRLAALIALVLWASTASAQTTHYMAVNGSDSNPCTSASRCATITHIMGLMSGGDTIVVGDGTYNQEINGLPSGSASAYTTVKAEHDWLATFQQSTASWALQIYQHSYITIQGINFQGGGPSSPTIPISVDGSNHIKLIRVSASNGNCTGNQSPFSLSGTDYVLIEDSHVWGCARYPVLLYRTNHTVLRRVVSRHDYVACDSWGHQSSVFTVYDADNTTFENSIGIDSGMDDTLDGVGYVCDALAGGIWWENHGDTLFNGLVERNGDVLGSIFLNIHGLATDVVASPGAGADSQYKISGSTTTRTVQNSVFFDMQGGGSFGLYCDTCGGNPGTPTLDIEHNLYGGGTATYGGAVDATLGVGISNSNNGASYASNTFKNSLVLNNHSFGNIGEPGDYNDYWNNGLNYLNVSAGAHDKAVNPGLLYLPRIEASSPLHGAASDGGDIGATIFYKYGVDGTLWGDSGWNTLTANPLWPFPYESVIKSDFSSYNCSPTCTAGTFPAAVRGFVLPDSNTTAPGRSYGGSRTLTSYIWEYLGNPCPSNVCNYGPPQPDFSVSASSSSQDVTAGAQTSDTIIIGALAGFTGTTSLSVGGLPTGASGSFSPSTVTTSGSSLLTITTTASTAAGTYTLTITGTSGSTSHTATVTLNVAAVAQPDFTLSASSSSLQVTAGGSASDTTAIAALNGFTGTVSLAVSGLPNGASGSFSPTTVTTSGSSVLTITTTASTAAGTYPLTITGTSGSTSHTATVTLTVAATAQPNFTLTESASSVQVTAGGSTSDTTTIAALNGFTGTVSLAVSGLPSGASGSFSPATVTTSGNSVLTITTTASTAAGTYPLTVTGTSGSTSHTATVTLNVAAVAQPNFTLSASPTSLQVTAGGSSSDTTTIAALNGFTGTVSLAVSGLPSGASGSFSPATVTTSGNSVLTITTTASTAAGAYTLSITGTSGSTSHTATATLTVAAASANLSVSVNPGSATVSTGQSVPLTVTAAGSSAIASPAFSCAGLPSYATCQFSTPSISTNGQAATSTLTLSIATRLASVYPQNANALHAQMASFSMFGLGVFGMLLADGKRRRKAGLFLLGILLFSTAGLAGCAGFVTSNSTSTPPVVFSFSVAGTVQENGKTMSNTAAVSITVN